MFNRCSKELESIGTSDLWNYIFPCSYYLTYSHVYFYTYIRLLNPSIGGEGRVCTIAILSAILIFADVPGSRVTVLGSEHVPLLDRSAVRVWSLAMV